MLANKAKISATVHNVANHLCLLWIDTVACSFPMNFLKITNIFSHLGFNVLKHYVVIASYACRQPVLLDFDIELEPTRSQLFLFGTLFFATSKHAKHYTAFAALHMREPDVHDTYYCKCMYE